MVIHYDSTDQGKQYESILINLHTPCERLVKIIFSYNYYT